jgi:hypothetical protein
MKKMTGIIGRSAGGLSRSSGSIHVPQVRRVVTARRGRVLEAGLPAAGISGGTLKSPHSRASEARPGIRMTRRAHVRYSRLSTRRSGLRMRSPGGGGGLDTWPPDDPPSADEPDLTIGDVPLNMTRSGDLFVLFGELDIEAAGHRIARSPLRYVVRICTTQRPAHCAFIVGRPNRRLVPRYQPRGLLAAPLTSSARAASRQMLELLLSRAMGTFRSTSVL